MDMKNQLFFPNRLVFFGAKIKIFVLGRESGEETIKSRTIKSEIKKFNLAIWVQRGRVGWKWRKKY
jgi:hypothetical protein